MRIDTERLILRRFERADLETFVAYRSDPQVARYQAWSEPYTQAHAERFLASQREVAFGAPGEWVQIAAVSRSTGTLVGDCAVHVSDVQPATAEVGVTLAPSAQRQGFASEALGAVVAHLFAALGLHRIYAETDDRNTPVHRLLERLGFRCEARLVDADWFKDEWCTLRVYALLQREWRS